MTDIFSAESLPSDDAKIEGTVGNYFADNVKISMRNVNVFYNKKQAINDINLDLARN